MIKSLRRKYRQFRREEEGMATIEFIILFPLFLMTTYSGIEYGIVAYNHSNLERALDETIQDVRMNHIWKYDQSPNAQWTHTLLKQIICDRAMALPDCFENLAIEMTPIDPYVGNPMQTAQFTSPFCVDTPEDIRGKDDQMFTPGASNQLMVIRACIEITPLFVGTTLGRLAAKDPDGQYELHATTVFVHEPA
nr:TadE family protein [uncultured Ruegeria sp.]